VRELRPGLWHWEAPHPDWAESELWNKNVSSYAIDEGEQLLFFDPLAVPSELDERAAERETAIVLTAPWHERDSRALVQRLGVPVYTPRPDTAEDLLRMFDFTAPEGWVSDDVRWLVDGEGEAHWYSAGDRLPVGVQAFPGHKRSSKVGRFKPPDEGRLHIVRQPSSPRPARASRLTGGRPPPFGATSLAASRAGAGAGEDQLADQRRFVAGD
jgi:hypothetical protein